MEVVGGSRTCLLIIPPTCLLPGLFTYHFFFNVVLLTCADLTIFYMPFLGHVSRKQSLPFTAQGLCYLNDVCFWSQIFGDVPCGSYLFPGASSLVRVMISLSVLLTIKYHLSVKEGLFNA